ncbi:MAG TPA: helix-turn-helix transcriptional regulator [bacterium]|nr:helix-turn-helix transcriptional regulator [bacterium]
MAKGENSTFFQFSTDTLPARARGRAVRALYGHPMLPTRLEPLEPLLDCSIRVDITQQALPGLAILSGSLCGLRQHVRPERSLQTGTDDLFFGVNLAGTSTAHQGGREVMLHGGDALFANRGKTGFTINRPTQVRFFGLRVSRRTLAPLVTNLDDAVFQLIPHHADALRLLIKYISVVVNDQPPSAPELRCLIATQVCDLIALAIGATRDAALIAQGRGVRAARLGAIKADIAANLRDCNLSAAAIAALHRVTPRYIHKLFESEGITFSDFVLRRRLGLVHRMLTDPRFAGRTISSVAFDIGFGDLSYFNRAFRRCYNATPSEVKFSAVRR